MIVHEKTHPTAATVVWVETEKAAGQAAFSCSHLSGTGTQVKQKVVSASRPIR